MSVSELSGASLWLTYAAAALTAYCIYEQIYFWIHRWRKGGKMIAGPSFAMPLVGGVVSMVLDPHKFWRDQLNYSWKGLSWNSMVGKYMIVTTDPEVTRKVFSYNDPDTLLMGIHPSGRNILGDGNLAFMHGPPHKAIRKSFLCLFTRKALGTYVQLQDGIIRNHISKWLQKDGEREIRTDIREMNLLTSQEVFAGPYLGNKEEREKFGQAFLDMTNGFLALPICLPGTAVWKAKQGRLYIISILKEAAAKSKAAMKAGGEPRCLMDFWAQRCVEEIAEAEATGKQADKHTTDLGMGDTIMDFLFASQDASTASLVWMLNLMADYPDVLEKVRQEQAQVRPDLEATITGEVLYRMTYARQVVKEVLRYRPPAPMVPQIVQKPFRLTDDYVAPKGTLIMPSIHASCLQGFTDSWKFDPDRFSPERQEDVKFGKNFMPFGHGPHYCVGKEYAINHLTAFLAIVSTRCTWSRRITEKSKDDSANWQYLPTIYPADSLIALSSRKAS